jgi:hypothetical protein
MESAALMKELPDCDLVAALCSGAAPYRSLQGISFAAWNISQRLVPAAPAVAAAKRG